MNAVLVVGLPFFCTKHGHALDEKNYSELGAQIVSHLRPGLIRNQSAISIDEYYYISGLVKQPGVIRFLYINGRHEIRWDLDPARILKRTDELSNPPATLTAKQTGDTTDLIVPLKSSANVVGVLSLAFTNGTESKLLDFSRAFNMQAVQAAWAKEARANSMVHYRAGVKFLNEKQRDKGINELETALRYDSKNEKARSLLKRLGKEYHEPKAAHAAD